ncbi:MAG: hypothetical protein JRG91_15895, partial [Deltaproteobacteria bacterium]|nr:hypothetical protein [Deltaproteobacteria bacterium]
MMRHAILASFFIVWGCAGGETCPANTFECGGMCYELSSDDGNCGACGVTCDDGQVCEGSVCVLSCAEGMSDCSGVCRDLSSDTYNCGICGMTCGAG